MLILNAPQRSEEKEQLYIAVRDKEGRIYSDDELRNLPGIEKHHQYYDEWTYRRQSFARFSNYLKKEFAEKYLDILDLGCGNGWMSHRLNREGHRVTGVDLNRTELEQAERVFGTSDSLTWIYADILDPKLSLHKFDVIVLAASCQYFPDMEVLTARLKGMLQGDGQIHLLDSKFYDEREITAAKQRSLAYYTQLGYPEMSAWYHYHAKTTIKALGFKKLYPGGLNFNAKLEWWALKY